MEKRFDTPRALRRVAPKHSTRVAVFRDAQKLAYGVVTNVSVTGACVATDNPLAPGSDVMLKLSFFQHPDLLEIPARVVWSRTASAGERGLEGLPLHGVQFTQSSAVMKVRLHALLDNGHFIDVFRPSVTEFDLLQNDLSSELERLGSKIHETTGDET